MQTAKLGSYQPLGETDVLDDHHDCRRHRLRGRTIPILSSIIFALAIVNVLLLSRVLRHRNESDSCASRIFTPAEEALDYEVVKFHAGPLNDEDDDIYSLPPSPVIDQAWRDLYEFGTVGIPPTMGPKLVNSTVEAGGQLIVQLDVFHQLHCLNKLRKALRPDYYHPEDRTESPDIHEIHITHCINSIRQSLQCSADISLITFNPQVIRGYIMEPEVLPSFNVLHSCRKFDKIQQWARERWIEQLIDDE